MALHKIRRGLDLPISGAPRGAPEDGRQVSRVAIMAADYVGLKPTMHVKVGDSVSRSESSTTGGREGALFRSSGQ